MFTLATIIGWLLKYKYSILFPIAVIEGPIITILGGFLVAQGVLDLYAVYLLLVVGDLVGDSLYYAIGRFGGRRFIKRWGYIFGLKEKHLVAAETKFKAHPKKILLIGKTQAWGSLTLVAAGITEMPYSSFLFINLIGTAVKTLLLLIIGYYFGQAYNSLAHYFDYFGIASIALTIIIILIIWLRKKYRS